MSQKSHTKVTTAICEVKTSTSNIPSSKINFTDKGGGVFESDPINVFLASAISIHAKYPTNISVMLIDKDATDYLETDVVIASGGGSQVVNINTGLLRQRAIHKAVIRVTDVSNFNDLKLMSKVMYEFGPPRQH